MKPQRTPIHPIRAVMAELAIGLAVCAGAYLVLVDPMDAQRESVRAEAESLRLLAQTAEGSMPEAEARLALSSARRAIDALAKRAALGRDEAAIFSGTLQLAGACGVRVESMQPLASRVNVRAGQGSAAGDSIHGYAIHVVGSFSHVAAFLTRLQAGEALTTIRAVRITPTMIPGSTDQQATIEAEWFAPDCRAMAGAVPVTNTAEGGR